MDEVTQSMSAFKAEFPDHSRKPCLKRGKGRVWISAQLVFYRVLPVNIFAILVSYTKAIDYAEINLRNAAPTM